MRIDTGPLFGGETHAWIFGGSPGGDRMVGRVRGWDGATECETLLTSTSVHTARPVGPPAGLLLALNARASRPMDTYLARAR